MLKRNQPITILMAEDDPDDRLLTREAIQESQLGNNLQIVEDGEQLLDYLYRRNRYAEAPAPRPGVILLDLNMPRMDGREALAVLKSDPSLRRIPVVVMTTSKAEKDITRTYDLGVSSFIVKPNTFDGLVNVMQAINRYWFEIVELPPV